MDTVAIVGANMAGASAAETLRRAGFAGKLMLLGDEPEAPYERPPLSKGYLTGATPEERVFLRPAAVYAAQGIELRLGTRAAALDAGAHLLILESGERIAFDCLLIATGSTVRHLDSAAVPGAELPGIHYLRTLADARRLVIALAGRPRVAIVGAGFIGCEVAAACRERGLAVTLIEALATPMERALGPELGARYAAVHQARGVDLRLGQGVTAFRGVGRVEELVTTGGERIACDVAVVGVGVCPATDWLRGSGVALDPLDSAVVVDQFCATSVSGIYAAGDVASWPYQPAGAQSALRVRLEHYDNALRQGEAAARNLLGQGVAYTPVPYFWSDQYHLKLQMVGYAPRRDRLVLRGRLDETVESGTLAAFYLVEGRLRAAALINRVRDLGPVRRLVAAGASLDPAQLADESVELRRLVASGG
jgi:3-phenylpropionate/trans-cinnamate dioxygenase ferredoxin reductase subunit